MKIKNTWKRENCRVCGKELKPDKESKRFGTEDWDGYSYFICSCSKIKDKRVRISIG